MALKPKYQKFVDEYFIDYNAKQAAVRAGYSPKSAEFQGSKLMAIPEISAEIARIRSEMAAKAELTREEMLEDLKEIKDANKKTFAPAALKAIEIILKMQGWNEPDKLDITANITGLDVEIIKKEKPDEQA